MTNISLKLPDDMLQTSGKCAESLNLSRSEYIRRAIDRMNQETRSRLRKKHLAEVSRKVRKESMKVNADFEKIEADSDA